MTREEIYREIEGLLGLVPTFIRSIPDAYLEEEWDLFKRLELSEDTHIPSKYKELMGVALSAATRCQFCVLFHTEAARLHGATDEEIEEAAHFAKLSTGWSTYVHGMQVDYDQFKDEVRRIGEYVTEQRRKQAA